MNCEDFLKQYGGHKYACGITILEKNLENFKNTINEIASNALTAQDLMPHIDIDMEIPVSFLDYKTVEEITSLEPFGEGNSCPVFCSRNLTMTRPPRVIKNDHIKLWISDGIKTFEAIGFGLAKDDDIQYALKKSSKIDLVYTVSFNTTRNPTSP